MYVLGVGGCMAGFGGIEWSMGSVIGVVFIT